jgi:hypothetical protein
MGVDRLGLGLGVMSGNRARNSLGICSVESIVLTGATAAPAGPWLGIKPEFGGSSVHAN